MREPARDLAIRLEWGQNPRQVVARVEERGRPELPPDAAVSVGRALPGLWESDDNDYLRAHLTKVLFPPAVRCRFRAEAEALGRGGGTLRVRLRLPAPSEEQPLSLPELRWETVRVPGVDAGPGVWDAWVRDPSSAPAPYGELGTDARFTLVREVEASSTTGRRAGRPLGPVVIADATGVYGEVETPTGTHVFTRPGDQELAAADGRMVELALDGSHLRVVRVQSPATAGAIRQRLMGAGAFYFGGHHTEGGLVVAERPGSNRGVLLDGDSLSRWLVEYEVPLAVLLACESAGAAVTGSASAPLSLAERLARDGVDQVVAVHGRVSHAQAARFAGAFFAALAQGHATDVALRRSAGVFEATRAVPVLYACRRDGDFSVGLRRRARPSGLSTAAHRIVTGPDPRAGAAPDERFKVSLETRWCLTGPPPHPADQFRRASPPLWDVLADPGGGDLTQPLNDFENTLHQVRLDAGLEPFEPRHWYVYDHDEHPDRATAGLTAVLVPSYARRHRSTSASPQPDRGVGLVVRKRAGAAADHGFVDDLRHLPDADWDLRVVVVQVHEAGERTDRVREAAREIARDLGIDEYLLRARTPGAVEEPTVPFPPARSNGTVSVTPAAALWQTITEAGSSLVMAAATPLDVVAVVDDLNRTNQWGEVSKETDRLRELALSWPAAYRKLLAAHAARRLAPARYASLCIAAADDADLGRWLHAASTGQGLPTPDAFRGLRPTSGVVDAVVLGLLRTGLDRDAVFVAWEREGPSSAVRRAVAVARARSLDGGEYVTEAELWHADVVIALDRAGLVRRDVPRLDPAGSCPGSWALLARRRPTEADARWLCGMETAMRRLVGLEPEDGSYDYKLQRDLVEHQGALRPMLPRRDESGVSPG